MYHIGITRLCYINFGGLIMKFEDFLMQPSEAHDRRLALEEEVEELQERLNGELKLSSILRYALKGPILSCPGISSMLPLKVQVLLAELATVEKEVIWLEKKVQNLRLNLYQEKKISKYWERKLLKTNYERELSGKRQNQAKYEDMEWISASLSYELLCSKRNRSLEGRRLSVGSATEMQNFSFTRSNETPAEKPSRMIRNERQNSSDAEIGSLGPNKLSEELLECLVVTFLNMNQTSSGSEGAAGPAKHPLSWMSSRGLTPRSTFNCKVIPSFNSSDSTNFDPHNNLPNSNGRNNNGGPYKNHIQITRRSLEPYYPPPDYNPTSRILRYLLRKLCKVDLALLSYKQKLAFWINIYNACIMHAYLQHGLPSTQEKMLELMNKAALNVGGIVLNALAIEHYILRYPSDTKYDPTDDKGIMLRSIYGLGYPEPNVTFALCRGNRSSPPLRVYTPDEIVNHLGTAKVEYLEASIDVTNKKKILVPKLLHWHMQDFADDMESLIEWIYSQLPQSSLLRRRMMECLSRETKLPIGKLVEIVPYEYEFRYLLPTVKERQKKLMQLQ